MDQESREDGASVTAGSPFPMLEPVTRPIRFVHRGAIVEVANAPTTRSVLYWLREYAHCVGTKEGCNEGDCGACMVIVGTREAPRDDNARGRLALRPVNSCLQFLSSLDGKALFTIEDLKRVASDGAGETLHPAQRAMVACHGSQCGFCTPGFTMSLAACYERHVVSDMTSRIASGPRPTRQGIADALSGNLCRCTGYRPILDAGESMFDASKAEPSIARIDRAAVLELLDQLADDPPLHYRASESALASIDPSSGGSWVAAPRTVDALASLRETHPDARMIAGATDVGLWVTKQFRAMPKQIRIDAIESLKAIEWKNHVLSIGAGASLESAWSALVAMAPALHEMQLRFASLPLRLAGTMGGNVANGSPIGDSAPILLALDARLSLRRGARQRRIALADFYVDYMKNRLEAGEFIEAIEVPRLAAGTAVRGYKIGKRYDCDISAVCAGLAIRIEHARVVHVRFAFGGMAAIVKRAALAEAAVLDAQWDEETLQRALDALAHDFTPMNDLRASARYRQKVAANLLRRLWMETRVETPLAIDALTVWSICEAQASSRPTVASGRSRPRAIAFALDTMNREADPFVLEPAKAGATQGMGAAVAHESAALHVSGEAAYIDDLPEWTGTLHAALGLAPVAKGRLVSIDVDGLRRLPGVVAALTAADIPGVNDCGAILHDEPILADDEIRYLGQPMFAILADDRDTARRIASRAREFVTIESSTPILAALEAHALQRYVVPPMHLIRETAPGATRAAIASAPHRLEGTLSVGGQEQFYLEGQISYALPQERGGMRVLCSTQHPSEMQHVIASALGIAAHDVQVECRRMGGGFGGKESQSAPFACIAALAARLTGRPVKLRLDRDDDFMITGGRHGFDFRYQVGYDAEGRVLGVEIDMISNAGHSADLSSPVMTRALCHFDNAYWLPEVAMHGYSARTDTRSNTAFRGFGGPQGAIAIEVILDSIARRLVRDPLAVRRANFYGIGDRDVTPYHQTIEDNIVAPLVDRLVASSDYEKRREEIADWNAKSAVLKRGIALTPVKFGISFNVAHYNQAGALVHVYTDGSVLVNHGGTEMGQGLHTKVAQVVAHVFGIDLARVRVTATDTHKVANTSATAASTGSDLNGKAAEDAALRILARLAAMLAKAEGIAAVDVRFVDGRVVAPGFERSFEDVVSKAHAERVQLWSDGFYATPGLHWNRETMKGKPFFYFAYGAAVSEVVIDTLTGEHRMLRADLLHDVGRSLNPAIDIGQIEGGFVQGVGWLTSEELVWNPTTGQLATHAPSTYKIPTANDCPPVFNVALYDSANGAAHVADTIHRSKAVGEPPLLLAFSVFLAIRDAVAACGSNGPRVDPPLRAPATPEAVLDAIDAVRG